VDEYTEKAMTEASADDGALLATFIEEKKNTHGLLVARDLGKLNEHLKNRASEIIYWFSHANQDALHLDGEPVDATNLYELLGVGGASWRGGLAVLNACQTAGRATTGEAFLSAVMQVGMSGIIGTEAETIDLYANRFGLSFLESFLDGVHDVARILRDLRRGDPLYLLYTAYCPPNIHVRHVSVARPAPSATTPGGAPGHLLSLAASVQAREYLLPAFPYLALGSYGRRQRALFAGRRPDCDRFAMLLDEPATRILILQGASGVGKTSFLRAEVIPFLEEECIGFRFIRDVDRAPWNKSWTPTDSAQDPESGVLFVRAGKDLVAELAQAVFEFTRQPYPRQNPSGGTVEVDLRAMVFEQMGVISSEKGTTQGNASIARSNSLDVPRLALAMRSEPSLLHRLLSTFGGALPFSILLIVDQAEEIFTQSQGDEVLAMLTACASSPSGGYKLILSMRTEYFGRMLDRLRSANHRVQAVREYLLTEFDHATLTEAILRPTVNTSLPYTPEIPFERYDGFEFEPGFAGELARQVQMFAAGSRVAETGYGHQDELRVRGKVSEHEQKPAGRDEPNHPQSVPEYTDYRIYAKAHAWQFVRLSGQGATGATHFSERDPAASVQIPLCTIGRRGKHLRHNLAHQYPTGG
jgi:hypothetical protein